MSAVSDRAAKCGVCGTALVSGEPAGRVGAVSSSERTVVCLDCYSIYAAWLDSAARSILRQMQAWARADQGEGVYVITVDGKAPGRIVRVDDNDPVTRPSLTPVDVELLAVDAGGFPRCSAADATQLFRQVSGIVNYEKRPWREIIASLRSESA